MYKYDDQVEIESLFGKLSVIYVPRSESTAPNGRELFAKDFDHQKNNESHYKATFDAAGIVCDDLDALADCLL